MNKTIAATAIAATLALGACTSAPSGSLGPVPTAVPQPTPQVIERRVEVPGPTVYVFPQECVDYIIGLEKLSNLRTDAYNALLDGKDPHIDAVNAAVDAVDALGAACVATMPGADASPASVS